MPGSGWPLSSSGKRFVGAAGSATSTAYSTVSVTPGDSKAYGSWVQVTASTAAALYVVSASVKFNQSTGTFDSFQAWLQVGTGAAASETDVATAVTGVPYTGITAGGTTGIVFYFPAPPLIAASTRLAVRGSRDGSTSTPAWTVALTYVLSASLES